MTTSGISNAHFDYLQHLAAAGLAKTIPTPPPWESVPLELRQEFEITSYGFLQRTASDRPEEEQNYPELVPLVATLGAYGVPFVFRVTGNEHGIRLSCGTWQTGETDSAAVLASALRSQFPTVTLTRVAPSQEDESWAGSLALGVPAVNVKRLVEAPLDRAIRGLQGKHWSIVVVCQPVDDDVPGLVRTSAMADARAIETEKKSDASPSPMSDQYLELLKDLVKQTLVGSSMGMWRYCAYLLAKSEDVPALSGLWRSMFAADEPSFEPMQVLPCPAAASMANGWILPDMEGEPGPGHFKRLLELNSIVTAAQLAQLIQFPKLDTPGLMVRPQARFDTAASHVSQKDLPIRLGTILLGNQTVRGLDGKAISTSGPPFAIKTDSLVKHTFIAGTTGSGKTNTVRALLKSVNKNGRRFMVIEPAKTEYRPFIASPEIAKDLRIYTMGNAAVSPFFLNPFEAASGTPVSLHLDLLKSLFTASFGMWTPLPQILERCLQAVYLDKGWDLVGGGNTRIDDGTAVPTAAWPTLSELIEKVEEVLPTLGYDEKITSDMRASLVTRLNGLCRGAKGRMLNTRETSDFGDALEHNVIFELESVADDDEKAFFMGLLMIRLFEVRRLEQRTNKLSHLLVIEEAHRILSNVASKGGEESANPRGKAVETFANLLSEMRAYGQGFVIADQVPAKLAPDVIKNSNLKIAHRVVARDDREILAGSMAMDDVQERALSTLTTGQSAIFLEGEDAPLIVAIDAMAESDAPWPSDVEVAKAMRALLIDAAANDAEAERWKYVTEDAAAEALKDEVLKAAYARFFLAATEGFPEAGSLLLDALEQAKRYHPPATALDKFINVVASRAASWLAERRGSQLGLAYSFTDQLRESLEELQGVAFSGKQMQFDRQLKEFSNLALRLSKRKINPFPMCAAICSNGYCIYRGAVADLIRANPSVTRDWQAAVRGDDRLQAEKRVLMRYGARLAAGGRAPLLRPISLCISQHLLSDQAPEIQKGIVEMILKTFDE